MIRLLRNVRIDIKIFAASALLLICMAALGSQAFLFLNALNADLTSLSDSRLPKQRQVLEIADGAIDTHMGVFRYVAWASTGVNAKALSSLSEQIRGDTMRVANGLGTLAARADLSERERRGLGDVASKWQRYATAAADTVEISTKDPALGTVMLGGTDDDYAKVAADLETLASQFTEQTRTSTRDLLSQARVNQRIIAWGGIFAVLLGMGLTLIVTRSIAGPIGTITKAMRALSSGDEDVGLQLTDRRDEIGQMWSAIEVFRDKLELDNRLLATRERELTTQNIRFDAALNNMTHGLAMYDKDNRLTVANRRYVEMYRLSPESTKPGCTLREMLQARAAAGTYGGNLDQYVGRKFIEGTVERKTTEIPDGRTINIVNCWMADGGWVSTHQDITEQRRSEERIAHMARHDALTGLPNRLLFREQMEQALAQVSHDERLAVLSVDLDCFKEVNDTLGHPAGDRLLQEVAIRLRGSVNEGDTVARLGGDEFAVIHLGANRPEDVLTLADRIVQLLSDPFEIDGHEISVGTSVGIAMAPADGACADELLKHVDIALYRAKADGRRTYRFFEPAMNAQLQARHTLEAELRNALARGEFELHYQPVISVVSNQVVGFEALIRWNHPERGLVLPGNFIPLAEETGLINAIGAWVLRQACAEAAKWPSHISMAVNLSVVQLKNRALIHNVLQALANAQLEAKRLELEITESVLWHDNEVTLEALHQLRALGVRIAMDDFGTGYSSLSYLRSFPFDKIKIDRSFVRDIASRSDCAAIVRAVANLGHTLGMVTTAEGVETEEQLARVKSEGCGEVQGYLFSKPLPAKDLASIVSLLEQRLAA
jgi:diguanylate cyclase (GGDEF)-like protein